MKKVYLLFCALVAGTASMAQTIPNGDMELWRSSTAGAVIPLTVQAPTTWFGADSLFVALGQSIGTLIGASPTDFRVQLFKETGIFHGGANCAKIMTAFQDTIAFPGVMSNAKTNVGITFSPPGISGVTYSGGLAVTVKPTSVSAWVQYEPGTDTTTKLPADDSGFVTVQALARIGTKDSVIGTGIANVGPTAGTWVQVTANINYPTDTVSPITLLRITFTSSGGGGTLPTDSSTLYVDDVTMTSKPNPIPIDKTGVRAVTANELVKVYPNPASGKLYLDGPANAGLTCNIIAVNGQVVMSSLLKGNDVLDISALAAGSYMCTITDKDGSTVQMGKVAVTR